ncbi:MAG TPA: sterol desaturase family protein [Myxococcota bacterium]|jgi:hypothetical protein|nr:sterol desaturase family protein [Myxococcota bacterium]
MSAAAAAPAPRSAHDSPRSLREALPILLAHPSPRILLAGLLVAAGMRLAAGAFGLGDLLALAIVAAYWPLQEWLIHVLVLHWKPVRVLGRDLDFAVPRKHREHHRDPWNYEILFIPIHSFLYTIPILVGSWMLLAPTPAIALTGIAAHLALALHYETVHFLVHTRVVPRGRLYERLWRNHRLHHFKNERYWYGVTMLSGDRLFGTAAEKDAVETSPTARALHGGASRE